MNPNSQSILVYAARYAHTRNTGAALQVVNEILKHWDSLSTNTKKQLIHEATHETLFNKEDWKLIIDKPIDPVETNYNPRNIDMSILNEFLDDEWRWKMKYCKHFGLSASNEHAWAEATNQYNLTLETQGDTK